MQCHSHLGSKYAAQHGPVCILQYKEKDIHVNLMYLRGKHWGGERKRDRDSRRQEGMQAPSGEQCSGRDRR